MVRGCDGAKVGALRVRGSRVRTVALSHPPGTNRRTIAPSNPRPRPPRRCPPDLAVEVLSPSTKRIDRGRKSELLARHRVPEYWLVDPDQQTLEVRLERDGCYPDPVVLGAGFYESVTLPGLHVDIAPLFVWP